MTQHRPSTPAEIERTARAHAVTQVICAMVMTASFLLAFLALFAFGSLSVSFVLTVIGLASLKIAMVASAETSRVRQQLIPQRGAAAHTRLADNSSQQRNDALLEQLAYETRWTEDAISTGLLWLAAEEQLTETLPDDRGGVEWRYELKGARAHYAARQGARRTQQRHDPASQSAHAPVEDFDEYTRND